MKDQFEVWDYNFPVRGLHPVVLISHPDRCAHAKIVNVLFCTSQRQGRQPYSNEVMLDASDGLSWETFCDCSIMFTVESAALTNRRGVVTPPRRNAIRERIRDMYLLAERE
jgi:mRNA-degrading endonuclease toxin of MazEF toxin-antitoxin module